MCMHTYIHQDIPIVYFLVYRDSLKNQQVLEHSLCSLEYQFTVYWNLIY